MNAANNINRIDGDPNGDGRGIEIQTLAIRDVNALQEAYVRKVLDTLGDLDNVLCEIVNESGRLPDPVAVPLHPLHPRAGKTPSSGIRWG